MQRWASDVLLQTVVRDSWSLLPCVLVGLLFASLSPNVSAAPKHTATLDDAYAVKYVGAVETNPDGKLLALEVDGEIAVIRITSLTSRERELARFRGSGPSWSPDGNRLAFFNSTGGQRQLFVWGRSTKKIAQITNQPNGISPNPYASGEFCTSSTISWSPDSQRIVFGTRLLGEGTNASQTSSSVRVFSSNSPVNASLLDGVFSVPSYWDAFAPNHPDLGWKMKAIDRNPSLGGNRLVVVDLRSTEWTILPTVGKQYYCPSWSPDGGTIAAAVDTSQHYPITYFGHMHVQSSALALFDFVSGTERVVSTPTARVGRPMWSPDGRDILMVVEEHQPIASFKKILVYNLLDGSSRLVSTPGEIGALESRWSLDGSAIIAKLSDRFVDSLWLFDRKTDSALKIDTLGRDIDSYSEIPGGSFAINSQYSGGLGQVIMKTRESTTFRLLYDANPQLADVVLGQQRRITWKNRSGEEVDGILILPPNYKPGIRYPIIVNAYPTEARDNLWLYPLYESTGQLQAARGYVIFRPELRVPQAVALRYPRGELYEEKARGAKGISVMIDDFTSGINYLVEQGIADPNRIGIFGHSNGGWAANMLVAKTSIIKAAVISSGISNAVMMSFFPLPMTADGIDPSTGGNVFDNLDDYVQLSAIFQMRNLKTSMLLTVGDQDWLWLPQMIAQYGVLRSEGGDVELVRYANEGHSLSSRSSIDDALARMNEFFDRHLKAPSVN